MLYDGDEYANDTARSGSNGNRTNYIIILNYGGDIFDYFELKILTKAESNCIFNTEIDKGSVINILYFVSLGYKVIINYFFSVSERFCNQS
jgi:hypothetical protein